MDFDTRGVSSSVEKRSKGTNGQVGVLAHGGPLASRAPRGSNAPCSTYAFSFHLTRRTPLQYFPTHSIDSPTKTKRVQYRVFQDVALGSKIIKKIVKLISSIYKVTLKNLKNVSFNPRDFIKRLRGFWNWKIGFFHNFLYNCTGQKYFPKVSNQSE